MTAATSTTTMTDPTPATTPPRDLPRVELCGLRLHAVTLREAIDHVIASLYARRGGTVVTPNLDHMRRISREPEYRALIEDADLLLADGMPLIWASRLRGTPLPERVAGSTMVGDLAAAAAKHGRSLFLLGGSPGAAEAAAEKLVEANPDLKVAGTLCPPMGFERDEQELQRIRDALRSAQPDLVYVGLGSPKQEELIRQMRPELPGAWWLGIGISLSFLGGQVKRAPRWVQKLGLEWVHRLCQEPRRLAKRYLLHGIPFAVRLLGGAAIDRFRNR